MAYQIQVFTRIGNSDVWLDERTLYPRDRNFTLRQACQVASSWPFRSVRVLERRFLSKETTVVWKNY